MRHALDRLLMKYNIPICLLCVSAMSVSVSSAGPGEEELRYAGEPIYFADDAQCRGDKGIGYRHVEIDD